MSHNRDKFTLKMRQKILKIRMNINPKKKKIDQEALQSSFMKIPNMKIEVARALLDIGLRETYETIGRSPEILMEDCIKNGSNIDNNFVKYFRLIVYCAENKSLNPKMLHPDYWK